MGTKKGAFALMALPKIDEFFTLLKGAKYFTGLDLCSGYYHIKLDEGSIPKSAFTTVFGKFEFLRCPFGLSQGQDFFICLIYNLFRLDKTPSQGQGSGSNNDTRSNFLKEQNQNCSRPQAFTKVTYHGFFKCEGKCYPNSVGIVLENIIINYILLMIFIFIFSFYSIL